MNDLEYFIKRIIDHDNVATAVDRYITKRFDTTGLIGIQPLVEKGDCLISDVKALLDARSEFITNSTQANADIQIKIDRYYEMYQEQSYDFFNAIDAVIESMDLIYRDACIPIIPIELQLIVIQYAADDDPICLNGLRMVNRTWNEIVNNKYKTLYRRLMNTYQVIRDESYLLALDVLSIAGIRYSTFSDLFTTLKYNHRISVWVQYRSIYDYGLVDIFNSNMIEQRTGELQIRNLNQFFDPWDDTIFLNDQTSMVIACFELLYGQNYLIGYNTFRDILCAIIEYYNEQLVRTSIVFNSDSDSDSD